MSRLPAGVAFEDAGVAAVSGITALQALTDVGGVEPGQRVLVIGASGGVVSFAVVDYTMDDYLDGEHRYDLIVDTGGRNRISNLRRALTAAGTLVIVGGEDGGRWTGGIGRQIGATLLSPFVRHRLKMFISTEHHSYLDRLAEFLASGAVTPAIGARFDLDEAPRAVAEMAAGTTSGKSLIAIRDATARATELG